MPGRALTTGRGERLRRTTRVGGRGTRDALTPALRPLFFCPDRPFFAFSLSSLPLCTPTRHPSHLPSTRSSSLSSYPDPFLFLPLPLCSSVSLYLSSTRPPSSVLLSRLSFLLPVRSLSLSFSSLSLSSCSDQPMCFLASHLKFFVPLSRPTMPPSRSPSFVLSRPTIPACPSSFVFLFRPTIPAAHPPTTHSSSVSNLPVLNLRSSSCYLPGYPPNVPSFPLYSLCTSAHLTFPTFSLHTHPPKPPSCDPSTHSPAFH